MIEKAKEFARAAHAGQKRWSGADYYEDHLLAVYEITKGILKEKSEYLEHYTYWFDIEEDEILVASLLHDVIEDTPITYEDIEKEFGSKVATIVNILTRPRDEEYAEYIFSIVEDSGPYNFPAAMIKLADLIHNSSNFPVDKRNNKYSKYLLSKRIIENYLKDFS